MLPKKTKIVCTIGPASMETETLEQMLQAGMNCVRINTAYGDFRRYKKIVENVRKVADIPVMVDLKGPEIRLKTKKEQLVKKGEIFEAGFNGEAISFNHNFINEMKVGDIVFIDNGRVRTKIIEKITNRCSFSWRKAEWFLMAKELIFQTNNSLFQPFHYVT